MATLTVSAADEKRVKAMGFLSNKGTDNFNARIITVNGKITAEQQRCIAEAAEKFGNGEVAFTTRLTVEVPGIPFDKIEEFQEFIAKEGLITGVQNLISVLRDYGEDNQNILQQLKQKYGNTFSDKQLEDFLKQS